MENRAHAIAAGLFVLLLGIALALTALWFKEDKSARLVPYVINSDSDVSGLKIEAPVRYRGVDVGRVRSVRLDPARPGLIRIQIGVEAATPVTRSTYAQLGFLGVTGLTFISLRDSDAAGERLASSENAPGEISMRPSLMDAGENLLGAVSEIAAKAGGLLNEDSQERVRRLLAAAEQAATRVARLAEAMEPAVREIPALARDARGVMSDASGTLAGFKAAAATAEGALAEGKIAAGRAAELAARLETLALKLDARLDTIDRVAVSAGEVGAAARAVQEETLPRINRLADRLGREARGLERLIQTLAEQPNSIVFGTPPPAPGPGESGFRP